VFSNQMEGEPPLEQKVFLKQKIAGTGFAKGPELVVRIRSSPILLSFSRSGGGSQTGTSVQPPPEQGDYKIPMQHEKYELF
jgi:hypothetical protein